MIKAAPRHGTEVGAARGAGKHPEVIHKALLERS